MGNRLIIESPLLALTTQLFDYDSQSYASSDVVPNTSGASLLHILANNTNSPTLYLMFFNASAVPGNGAVPAFMPIPLAQNTPLNLFLNDVPGGARMYGWFFSSGLVWAASTSAATLTLDSTNSLWVSLRYLN